MDKNFVELPRGFKALIIPLPADSIISESYMRNYIKDEDCVECFKTKKECLDVLNRVDYPHIRVVIAYMYEEYMISKMGRLYCSPRNDYEVMEYSKVNANGEELGVQRFALF